MVVSGYLQTNSNLRTKRNSGVELIKVVALFAIIVAHLSQTLSTAHEYIQYPEFIIPITSASKDPQVCLLALFYHLGSLGNLIFFIASFWFLSDRNTVRFNKVILITIDVWVISVLSYFFWDKIVCDFGGTIPVELVIKSFFPTIFANNWFITCYILIYTVSPVLNKLTYVLSRKTFFAFCTVTGILYFGIGSVKSGLFFSNQLLIFLTLYFIVSYVRRYANDLANNVRFNLYVLLISSICFFISFFILELLGQHLEIFSTKMLFLARNDNIFLLFIAFSLFNLFKSLKFSSRIINIVASTSLIVYVTHENIIFRQMIRPFIFTYLHDTYGYDSIVVWVILLAIILFILTFCIAMMYKLSVQRITTKLANYLGEVLLSSDKRVNPRNEPSL